MQKLNKEATSVFMAILEQIPDGTDCVQLREAKDYMPLEVKVIEEDVILPDGKARLYSLAHVSDAETREPEVIFAVVDGRTSTYPVVEQIGVYPIVFRQDDTGIDRELVHFNQQREAKTFDRTLQAEATNFSNRWMENLRYQQHIKKCSIPDVLTWMRQKKGLNKPS